MIFGAFMPQGWKMELAGIDGAAQKWEAAVAIAVRAEELGYDSIWVYDHFHNIPRPAHEAVFECWTTMAAVSQRTSRIRLGQMVGCNSYRHPSLLAKITSMIDVISGGRLDWGIGAGWYENEYRGYGFEFPAAKDRIGMLRESGEQLTLRVVARYADRSNFGGSPEEWARKCEILKGHCAAVGRDYDEIRKTWSPEVFVRETEAEVLGAGSLSVWGGEAERWRAGNLVGTPEQVAEKIQVYADLGCSGVVPWCSDYPGTESLELFATKVIPQLR
jgi:alkanesulfonate monooxygenase SsuD/methylene tetrahydromethanopterin reductase-like flavin-dependent oxidoreductase (luciferase family)